MANEPINLLLAEDNEDDVILVQEVLEDSTLIKLMHVVRDGEELLAYLHREGKYSEAEMPGLILLDINMPRKNGFEVLDEVKQDPALSHIPIIVLTVTSRDEEVIKAYSKGASTFIRKPVDFDEFQQVMKQLAVYWTNVATLPNCRKRVT